MAAEENWRRSFYVPNEDRVRPRAMTMIHRYLRRIEDTSGIRFAMSHDAENPHRIWVEADTRVMLLGVDVLGRPCEAILACVERDIMAALDQLLIPPVTPKSVWEWIRENPYK